MWWMLSGKAWHWGCKTTFGPLLWTEERLQEMHRNLSS
jgi:hypothetical protein